MEINDIVLALSRCVMSLIVTTLSQAGTIGSVSAGFATFLLWSSSAGNNAQVSVSFCLYFGLKGPDKGVRMLVLLDKLHRKGRTDKLPVQQI